ncbi:MAG TPA: hypothetical protein VIT62_14605 [Lysobacter sp.]
MTTTPQSMSDDELPLPAFRLTWRGGAYYVSEPSIGNTDCYTAEQLHAVRVQAFHDGQVAGRATAEQDGKVEGDGPSLAYRGLQSCRDMLCNQFTPKYGENFDGYLDAMTDALTWMRWAERRIAYAKPTQPAATHHNVTVPEGYELVSALEMKRLRQRDKVEQMAVYGDSVWYWQGDGADVPESLSCPVIMAADTLRALLAPAATQQPVAWAAMDTRGQMIELFMTEEGANNWRDWEDDQDKSLKFAKAIPLRRIVKVLGPVVPNSVTDEGARWEWQDALDTAVAALAPVQEKAP